MNYPPTDKELADINTMADKLTAALKSKTTRSLVRLTVALAGWMLITWALVTAIFR